MRVDGFDYPYKSFGYLKFDPQKDHKKFRPWWALLECDSDIVDLYIWFMKRNGVELVINKLWGPHISCIKGEEPPEHKDEWGDQDGQRIEFYYSNYIMYDNGRHAWINCISPQLEEIREFYGVPPKLVRGKFHLTLGTLKGTVPRSRGQEFIKI